VARPILVIVWHLLAEPKARFTDLGPGYYQTRTDTDRRIRNHIRQIALTRPGSAAAHPFTVSDFPVRTETFRRDHRRW
jgi:hypothetical protein